MMTQEEINRRINSNPKIKKFYESKDNDKASRLISMAYLLQSIANEMTEEANALIEKYGLFHFNIKLHANRLEKAFDMYHRQISSMIRDEEVKRIFCDDYEEFRKLCDKYMYSDKESKQ